MALSGSQPIGNTKSVDIEVDDEGLSDEDRDLLKAAFGEIETTDGCFQIQRPKRRSRDYRILSSVLTAVTVMVLGFLAFGRKTSIGGLPWHSI